MKASPASAPATITVNSFNTSLPAGQVLVNFTANTTKDNNIAFTIEKGPRSTGIISDTIRYINQTPLAGANVTLYNQDGSP